MTILPERWLDWKNPHALAGYKQAFLAHHLNAMKPQHSSFRRILLATIYSKQGLQTAFKSEAAFRQELFFFVLLLPVIYFLPISLEMKLLLLSVNTVVLITELLNSAIEAAVDLVSPGFNEFAKNAKDIGSAAVLIALLLAAISWITAIVSIFAL